MKKIFIITSIIFLFLFLTTGITFAGNLDVITINVGQGDSIFIKGPGGIKILIDAGGGSLSAGNAYDNIKALLSEEGVSSGSPLDYIILTHYHDDHYAYIDNVISDFGLPKKAVIDRGGDKKYSGSSLADIPDAYLLSAGSKRNATGVLSPGAKIDLGSGAYLWLFAIGYPDFSTAVKKVKILDMPDVTIGDEYENAKSLVFLLKWNGFDMLLGGDSNEEVEDTLGTALRNKNVNLDVYKVHHHGSATSSSLSFLQDTLPELAVCSVGNSGSYQHPRKESYDRLYSLRCFIYQTSRGYSGSLSYAEPPAGYGTLFNGNVKIEYSGDRSYTIFSPLGDRHIYNTDE